MAITFVGSHVGTHNLIVSSTVNFSSLLNESGGNTMPVANDWVYVAVENSSTIDRTQAQLTPSGYTAVHTDNYQNDTSDSNFQVSRKLMGATPDTSVAIPASNAITDGLGYAIYVFRGVDTTTPEDVTTVVFGGINSGIANASPITPVTAGAWIAAFAGAAVASGAVFTNPVGMSTTTNHFRSATTGVGLTNDANIGGALYTAWTSAIYDPAAFGGSTSTNTGSWSAVTIALRPILANVTVALTGQSIAGALGTLLVAASLVLSGRGAATSQGSIAPQNAQTLSGQGLVGSQGSVAPSTTIPVAGQSLTAGQGNVTVYDVNVTRALTGQAFAVAGGSVIPANSLALIGGVVTASRGPVAAENSLALIGQGIVIGRGTLIPATSLVLTGHNLTAARDALSPAISLPLSGASLTVSRGTVISVGGDVMVALTGHAIVAGQGILGVGALPSTGTGGPLVAAFIG